MRLVLASNNAGKLAELQALFAPLGLALVGQGELGIAEADEPHLTFIENALAKARHAAQLAQGAAIADDSGLCVDALGGAPGVRSARYAEDFGQPKSDRSNNWVLLERLSGVKAPAERTACFVCALVAVRSADDPQPLVALGRWSGVILPAPRGESGFGYDPLLLIPELQRSVAELNPGEKNARSHRGLAAREMLRQMREVWGLG
ncbi:MAG: RdgB/HAM1 family non-canonical purine NTP pyrophosphatase [Pseudomonadota bacterium]|nr:RdgB/HAM1 family non-canonical purine NTP pyrophosphatase [Pseudomonadota bacterium]